VCNEEKGMFEVPIVPDASAPP